MLYNIFKVVYFVGFIVGSVIRAVYTKRNKALYTQRHKQDTIVDDRETVLDKLLLSLISLGMIVAPLIYALSSWLDFADYSLPTWASLLAGLAGAAIYAFAFTCRQFVDQFSIIIIYFKMHLSEYMSLF